MNISFKQVAHNSPEYLSALELRDVVLRKPIGLEFPEYQIDLEAEDIHIVGLDRSQSDPELVACLLLRRISSAEVHMKQVAVAPEHQRRGIGSGLVEASEIIARSAGYRRMVLHARTSAIPFYLALDYQTEGPQYEEVGIPHRNMFKDL